MSLTTEPERAAPRRPARARAPEALGPWRVHWLLGVGGAAEVWRAAHPDGRVAALKWLSASTPGARRRFVRELELHRELRGPGLARVLDEGVAEGLPWMAVELVEGTEGTEYARQLRRRSPAERVERVRRVGQGLCAALGVLHARGIVHRDVKLANVLVRPDGEPVLVDLGVAEDEAALRAAGPPGHLVGTPSIAAPEQLGLGVVTRRADQYALGCVLYQLLSGRRVHEGLEGAALRAAHRDGSPVDLRRFEPLLAPAVWETLARLLARDPEDRFADVGAVAASLAAWPVPDAHLAGRQEVMDEVLRFVAEAAEEGPRACGFRGAPGSGRRWMEGFLLAAAAVYGVGVRVEEGGAEPGAEGAAGEGAPAAGRGPELVLVRDPARPARWFELPPLGVADVRRTVAPLLEAAPGEARWGGPRGASAASDIEKMGAPEAKRGGRPARGAAGASSPEPPRPAPGAGRPAGREGAEPGGHARIGDRRVRVAERLHRWSGGIPALVLALAPAAVAAEGGGEGPGLGRGLDLDPWLGELDEVALELARSLAAAPGPLGGAWLAQEAERAEGGTARVAAALGRLVARGVVLPVGDGWGLTAEVFRGALAGSAAPAGPEAGEEEGEAVADAVEASVAALEAAVGSEEVGGRAARAGEVLARTRGLTLAAGLDPLDRAVAWNLVAEVAIAAGRWSVAAQAAGEASALAHAAERAAREAAAGPDDRAVAQARLERLLSHLARVRAGLAEAPQDRGGGVAALDRLAPLAARVPLPTEAARLLAATWARIAVLLGDERALGLADPALLGGALGEGGAPEAEAAWLVPWRRAPERGPGPAPALHPARRRWFARLAAEAYPWTRLP